MDDNGIWQDDDDPDDVTGTAAAKTYAVDSGIASVERTSINIPFHNQASNSRTERRSGMASPLSTHDDQTLNISELEVKLCEAGGVVVKLCEAVYYYNYSFNVRFSALVRVRRFPHDVTSPLLPVHCHPWP